MTCQLIDGAFDLDVFRLEALPFGDAYYAVAVGIAEEPLVFVGAHRPEFIAKKPKRTPHHFVLAAAPGALELTLYPVGMIVTRADAAARQAARRARIARIRAADELSIVLGHFD